MKRPGEEVLNAACAEYAQVTFQNKPEFITDTIVPTEDRREAVNTAILDMAEAADEAAFPRPQTVAGKKLAWATVSDKVLSRGVIIDGEKIRLRNIRMLSGNQVRLQLGIWNDMDERRASREK